jgi:hypothetical protein
MAMSHRQLELDDRTNEHLGQCKGGAKQGNTKHKITHLGKQEMSSMAFLHTFMQMARVV